MKLQDLLLWGGAAWLLWMMVQPQRQRSIDVPISEGTTPEEYYEEVI